MTSSVSNRWSLLNSRGIIQIQTIISSVGALFHAPGVPWKVGDGRSYNHGVSIQFKGQLANGENTWMTVELSNEDIDYIVKMRDQYNKEYPNSDRLD